MKTLQITQSRSLIGSSLRQRRTMKALGLRRVNHSVIHSDTPVIQGMLKKVDHLVHVDEFSAQETKSN